MALLTSFITSFTLLLLFVIMITSASDTGSLLKFRDSLENNNALLSSWNASIPPCSGSSHWPRVQCYKGHVSGLKLENMRLKGVIDVQSLLELPYLRTISLMNNDFDTEWPDINKIVGLKTLFLSNNNFSGEIPAQAFQGMQWLKKIHLSNNQFTGNEGVCGAPLSACSSPKKKSTASIVAAAVLVIVALIVIGAVILLVLHQRRKQAGLEVSAENPSSIMFQSQQKEASSSDEGSRGSPTSSSHRSRSLRLLFVRDDREKFDYNELFRASAKMLGSGCFSSSYKVALLDGPEMVVKRFKQMNNVGREEFDEHMRRIGRLNHPNLLPLVAYYYRKVEKLLVTDFVHNGSLAVRLHGYQALGQESLDWASRLKIVKGIAKGIEHLYKEMPSLIAAHGHLKSSNVLLSESLEPILTDYGLGPVINQDLAPEIMVIYKSPEYVQHGRITKKTDVWSLGILILEILTGKFPANLLQGKGSELSLANWVHSVVPQEWTREVFDKDMDGTNNSEGEMVKLLKIALACCEGDVDKRWDLKEAVERIHEVNEEEVKSSLSPWMVN
ncbi:pollen receptor-like kinase 2 isoform X2 [Glycine soja]|uniref:Pollen receptor-like kinase 1 isoform B n=2 Tax=Glycine soja TaxID=3848 RepID=A0A445LWV7_GLYSO|nr:pollen receptor-like kinase 2 isoform X2 [Glycine soja]RZC27753.1 Pollen receptor-like kinase 1 isoform B [Glycine soja]